VRRIGLLLVLLTSTAHADSRLVAARIGIAGTADSYRATDVESSTRFGPGFHLDVGARIVDALGAGIHFGYTRNHSTEEEFRPPDVVLTWHDTYTSWQIGVSVQYTVGRFWVAPWVGTDDRTRDDGDIADANRQFAGGLSAGADLYVHPTGNRLGIYGDITGGRRTYMTGFSSQEGQSADVYLSLGIAYRYW
jgi:hypothetical protein